MDHHIKMAHKALKPAQGEWAPPRSFFIKFLNYRMKEEILHNAWQKKGFICRNKQINMDSGYLQSVNKKRQEYTKAK